MRVNFSTGRSTGEWEYDLLAAIVRRAMLDAQGRGQTAEDAQDWLDFIAGERWRKTTAQEGQGSTKTGNRYIDVPIDMKKR